MGPTAEVSSCKKAKRTHKGLQRNLVAFINTENSFSGSAELKMLDSKRLAVLEDMVWQKRHNSLRGSLVKAETEIPTETKRAEIGQLPEHMKICVGASGGHFE
jgi:hypothetical protein